MSVPASLSTDGETVTLTVVDPASDAAFPIIADPAPTASAARRGAPLRLMTFNTRSTRPTRQDTLSGDPGEHEAHSRRVGDVIYNQLRSKALQHRVPAIAGLQEMCLRDLADVQKRLQDRTDEDEPNANIRWRSSFRRTISTGNCPDAEGPRGRQFGIATIRNVVVTAGESRRYRESAKDPRINPASGRRVEARAYIRQQIDVQGRDVEFFNTHLIDDRAYVRPGGELPVQRLQSRRLLELAQGVNTPRAAVGDFNNHPNSELVGDWLSDFRDVDRCRGDNRFPECDELTAGAERIDYIFTRGMGINDANVANVDEGTSDHDSLVASTQVE